MEDKEYHKSGEKVEDIIPKSIPEKDTTKNIKDSMYSDEMYSEEQKERHEKSDINVFSVDGVPSRWEHNKKMSKWHFDPFKKPEDSEFKVVCKFQGDWSLDVENGKKRSNEETLLHYRPRGAGRQDKDLHDGELLDIQRASGRNDHSAMFNYKFASAIGFEKKSDNSYKQGNCWYRPGFETFVNIVEALGLDCHQGRIHIQKLGQSTPFHIDQQMRYSRSKWRDIWLNAGADKDPLKLRRFLIALNDWDYGHVWQFGNSYYHQYHAGECVVYDWTNMPHATSNMGYSDRITLQLTGFISDKTRDLMENGHKDLIIKV